MKTTTLLYILDGLSEFSANFQFWVNYSFKLIKSVVKKKTLKREGKKRNIKGERGYATDLGGKSVLWI